MDVTNGVLRPPDNNAQQECPQQATMVKFSTSWKVSKFSILNIKRNAYVYSRIKSAGLYATSQCNPFEAKKDTTSVELP